MGAVLGAVRFLRHSPWSHAFPTSLPAHLRAVTHPGLISLQHFPLLLSLASVLSIHYSDHSAHYSLSRTPPPFRCWYFAGLSLECQTPSPFFSLSSPAHHLWPPSLPPIIFSTAVFALCLGSPGCNLDNQMKNNRNSREEPAWGSPPTVRSHYSSCDCDVSLYSAR